MTKKLAIISTHPIQYYAPVFQLLAKKMNIKVFYTAGNQHLNKFDHGFKKKIEWDIPLLSDYDYEFLDNKAKDKGSHHFKGIINPDAIAKINAYQPDAILIYGWSYVSHLKIMRHFKGKIPVYFRGDSMLLDQSVSFKNLLKGILLKWVYQQIDTAFYVGTANKAYFKKYGLGENQLVFAPHAIDNARFSTNKDNESIKIRERLNINKDDILILFAGKLEPKKDPELLLEAFKNLTKSNVHLLFVGNGILEEILKSKVINQKLTHIHFMDFQNQTAMPAVYQACDLFCLPSKGPGETWGLAVNEAMAAGKAVLTSDKVGCYLDLVNEDNGSTFKNQDLSDLTQKLIALTKDKATLKTKGINAFNHIQDWSFEQQVNAVYKYVNR
ncbi:glycosyltransferase family 4 protein [Pedobacter polaris]|uniref:Glycosyltransferase family 4 protein n=1 Tax=Pedobacter polaris TaxID=2571273 RepID=A0A4U1CNA6_9SPHI|nr:glycosyltransferase family 4 protein [Pedobacter polaris]TKC08173.1 glycosyltransferase family 4 protein [Pedobacter polaris]